jgi:uncharacterized protein (DUF58 family)
MPVDPIRIQPLSKLEFFARQVVEGFLTGLHRSPFHGFSVEFAEHRLYNTGESTRYIDWKLYGKTDKLFVKRFEEETNLRCQLVIDTSASMFYPLQKNRSIETPDKLMFSAYSAAALAYLFRRQRDAVGLTTFSSAIDYNLAARSGKVHMQNLLSQLDLLTSAQRNSSPHITDAATTLHYIAETVHKRSLIVLFSDMFDSSSNFENLFQGLQHLKHKHHEVILFQVVDKKHELTFDFPNRPTRFIDIESGAQLRLNPAEIKEAYLQSSSAFMNELKYRCNQYKIDLIEADINKGFEQIMLPYLMKRSRLY